jgi:hypothetical protein
VAVRADHVAFLDFGKDRLPVPVRQIGTDVELLVAPVVELEDDRVVLSAVQAGVIFEVPQEPLAPLDRKRSLPLASLRDVAQLVRGVVLVVVDGPARPAQVVPLPSLLSPPVEALDGFRLTAASASSSGFFRHHEHTFASASDGMRWRSRRGILHGPGNTTEGGGVGEPQDIDETGGATLTDEEIETVRIGATSGPGASTTDDGDDTGDTGDDSGDTSDTADTGDDSGDSTDTGDDSGSDA